MATKMENLFGRTVIETSEEELTSENILEVLEDARGIHETNATQIEYLYGYYKGDQAILSRQKEYNSDINNRIVENRAKEIVDFWTGYLMGEPIQYIGRGDVDSEKSNLLNDMMLAEDKDSIDVSLADWQNICGTAYRCCLPDETFEIEEEGDEVPFEISSLDPRQTFVIYSTGIKKEPLAGVYYVTDEQNTKHYTVYTKDTVYYTVGTDNIESTEANPLGMIPIIEYPANEARLGAFEPVLSLLDALNTLDSNSLDGVEQFIQALIVFTNAELEEGTTAQTIKEKGVLCLKKTSDFEQKVDILAKELNQQQADILKASLYQAILTICAMPNRNGGRSTSDTGIAVVYRDGWSAAETAAKKKEMVFKKSERAFLKLVMHISNGIMGTDFNLKNIDIKFTRRNYENIETKANVLNMMLNNEKINPKLAFIYSNLFADPEEAYRISLEAIESAKVSTEESDNTIDDREVE